MRFYLFLTTFLLCSSTMYSMERPLELVPTNVSSGLDIIPDELLPTAIGFWLDRPARDDFRRTCKKYFELLLSQDELNKNYRNACNKKYKKACIFNPDTELYWKNLGGLWSHQEFANAIKNKKDKLAMWLLEKKTTPYSAYYLNILKVMDTSTIDEILPVIEWLLKSKKLGTYFDDSLNCAKKFIDQCPDIQKIIDFSILVIIRKLYSIIQGVRTTTIP